MEVDPVAGPLRGLEPRREVMLEPDEVAAMMRLHRLGWGTRRLAQQFGCSRTTVRRYIAAGGWQPFAGARRGGKLDGLEAWLRERFQRHRGNADVVRQDLERERGITIASAAVSCYWRDHRINIVDTPGHIDFTAEVQRSLRVLDGGVVVFDAVHGVEPQSETVWRQADRFHVPRICFINKMDRTGADFGRSIDSIRERLEAVPVAIQVPIGAESSFVGVVDLIDEVALFFSDELGREPERREVPDALRESVSRQRESLIEAIVETDDVLLARYLEGDTIGPEDLRAGLRRATLAGKLVPVLCGAALRNRGVQPVLDAIVDYLPSPLDVPSIEGVHLSLIHI